MTQLSHIFRDSLATTGYDKLTRICQTISSMCNAPTLSHESLPGSASAISPGLLFAITSLGARVSHAIASDSHRKNVLLKTECARLKGELSNQAQEAETLRRRNNQLIDVCNLIDEAARLPEDIDVLLELLNASLEYFPMRGLNDLVWGEVKLKYESLISDHRPLLVCMKNFQNRLREDKEKFRILEASRNTLISQKNKVVENGAKALKKHHEGLLKVQIDRESAISE
ncbi:hypothetical protein C5167_030421 [Papaver somniferum]|uniref:uncharacterized protein LOC113343553 n=1 Tax=Papaver somniferum TaxID=3469 RepID=UPI000E6FAD95|nr:uncharacterized protein LOC113343553 [Papaver somniferum]RZC93299.1 hypothetical protein C5167_030421 [Papaver somniferum]